MGKKASKRCKATSHSLRRRRKLTKRPLSPQYNNMICTGKAYIRIVVRAEPFDTNIRGLMNEAKLVPERIYGYMQQYLL